MNKNLNTEIAKALGYKIIITTEIDYGDKGEVIYHYRRKIRQEDKLKRIPNYSTSAEAMLELDKEMRKKGFGLRMITTEESFIAVYKAIKDNDNTFNNSISANTEPLVRALAAYKALTGKEWKDKE